MATDCVSIIGAATPAEHGELAHTCASRRCRAHGVNGLSTDRDHGSIVVGIGTVAQRRRSCTPIARRKPPILTTVPSRGRRTGAAVGRIGLSMDALPVSLDIFTGSPTRGDVVANMSGAGVVAALVIPRRYGRDDLSSPPKVTRTR
jgi:hypothetical protein